MQLFKSIISAIKRSFGIEADQTFYEEVERSLQRITWQNRDYSITVLCHLYSRSKMTQQEYIRSHVNIDLVDKLSTFIDAKAAQLLNDGTKEDLNLGLIALAILNEKGGDFRDTLSDLAKLYYAAKKHNIDADAQITSASVFCSKNVSDVLRNFVLSKESLKDINAFGFEVRDGRFAFKG
jgi:hypothetical protein